MALVGSASPPCWKCFDCGHCSEPESSRSSRRGTPFGSSRRSVVHRHAGQALGTPSQNPWRHADPGVLFCGSADPLNLSNGDHGLSPRPRTGFVATPEPLISKPLSRSTVSPLSRRTRSRYPRSRTLSFKRQPTPHPTQRSSSKILKKPSLVHCPSDLHSRDKLGVANGPPTLKELRGQVSCIMVEKDRVAKALRECEEQAVLLRRRVDERRRGRCSVTEQIGV